MVEMAICLPIFLLFFSCILQAIHFFHLRLELVEITRSYAMYLSREENEAGQWQAWHGLLESSSLRHYQVSFSLGSVGFDASALPAPAAEAASHFQSMLLGSRLKVRCVVPARSTMRLFFPDGVTLEQELVFKSGTWKDPGLSFLKDLLEWGK